MFVLALQIVERNRNRSGPGDSELQRYELEIVRHHDTNPIPGRHTNCGQAVGQASRLCVDLGIGHCWLIGDHEGPITKRLGGSSQHLAERARFSHLVPFLHDLTPQVKFAELGHDDAAAFTDKA